MFVPALAQQGNGLVRTSIVNDLGNYTLLPAGDTEFYFRIGAHYKIYFIDKLYHYHRVWSQNYTRIQVLSKGKAEKNIYDIKKTIFDYYFHKQKITRDEHDFFSKENQYEYNKFLIAQCRQEKKYLQFFQLLINNLNLFPFSTIQFYIRRIIQKLERYVKRLN